MDFPPPQHLDKGVSTMEDKLGLRDPYITFFGLIIAIATVGIPLLAVLSDIQPVKEVIIPITSEIDGPNTTSSMPISRVGKFNSRDSRGESK